MTIPITTALVKELRDATGVSVMQCKKALEEAEGNMEKAIMILKKKSSDIAAKKADRTLGSGVAIIERSENKSVMLSLLCETDYVAKNEDFQALAHELAILALTSDITAIAPEKINPLIQKIGENIQLGTVTTYEGGVIGSYVHTTLKNAVLVELSGGTEALAKDIAMHIAAMKPEFLSRESIPEEKKVLARELFEKEVAESDKPADIKEKMLIGKIDSYFKELTLLEQPFVKDGSKNVATILQDGGATIIRFEQSTVQ